MTLSAINEWDLEDCSKVTETRKTCHLDPLGTFEKLQNGEKLEVPPILELPKFLIFHPGGLGSIPGIGTKMF